MTVYKYYTYESQSVNPPQEEEREPSNGCCDRPRAFVGKIFEWIGRPLPNSIPERVVLATMPLIGIGCCIGARVAQEETSGTVQDVVLVGLYTAGIVSLVLAIRFWRFGVPFADKCSSERDEETTKILKV